MTDAELQEIETAAVELAAHAGKLLMGYFRGPLQVDYKQENKRSPVTDADHAADEYLRSEIHRRFPDHAVLTEEAEDEPDKEAAVVWIIDPLDGTANFLNGLPAFGVSIGVVEDTKPVVGVMFVPSIDASDGHVLHARLGGGTFDGEQRVSLAEGVLPGNSRLAGVPQAFWRIYAPRRGFRGKFGDMRSMGSITFEMAMVCRRVFQYAVFGRAWIWDVAAGIMLVQEAGGQVLTRHALHGGWRHFEAFTVKRAGIHATPGELRQWRQPIMLGTPQAVGFVSRGLAVRRYRLSRLWRFITQPFRYRPRS